MTKNWTWLIEPNQPNWLRLQTSKNVKSKKLPKKGKAQMKVPRLTLSRPWRSGSAWTRRPTSTRRRWPSCASCCRSRHHSRSLWPAWPGFWREKRVWSWFCWPGQERIWLRLNPVGSWRWGLALRSSKSLLHPCKVIGPNVFSKSTNLRGEDQHKRQ